MRLRLHLLALTILLLPVGHDALAQKGLGVGSFQSFKGVGLSFETLSPSGREFNTFTLYADLASVYLGDNPDPGVKFNFSHNIRIAQFNPQTLDDLSLIAGSGFSTGWVRDSGRDKYGLCGALSGTFGARAVFPCMVCFILGITLETGLLLYDNGGHPTTTLYRDGIYQTILPHLTILYQFK